MKIEHKEAAFQPIIITLESQEEVDQMYALMNYNRFYNGDITDALQEYLEDKASVEYKPTDTNSNCIRLFGNPNGI